MARKGSMPLDEVRKNVLRSATKTPKSAAELADRVNARVGTAFTARGIGRAVGTLVQDGQLIKSAERKPRYHKAA